MAKRRLLEAISTVTSTGTFTAQARKSFRFLALEFNSQNTNACMRIRNRRTYIYICDRTCEKGPCRASFQNRVIATIGKSKL